MLFLQSQIEWPAVWSAPLGNERVLTRAVVDGLDVTVLKYFGEAFGQEHSNVGVGRIVPQGYQDSGAILSCLSYSASNGVTFARGELIKWGDVARWHPTEASYQVHL